MKTKLVVLSMLWIASPLWACQKGYTDYQGLCVDDQKPAEQTESTVKPSSEKPPRNPQPDWATGVVKADMGKPGVEQNPLVGHDLKSEREER